MGRRKFKKNEKHEEKELVLLSHMGTVCFNKHIGKWDTVVNNKERCFHGLGGISTFFLFSPFVLIV